MKDLPSRSDEPDRSTPPARSGSAPVAIATAVALALLVLLVRQTAFLVDDSFITFRFARNWIELGAPVFNAFELAPEGRAVEGYSNFLWMATLAVLDALGADLPAVVGPLQLVLAAATLILVARRAARQFGLGTVAAGAAPILLATSPAFVAWSSGGMETTLFTLLITGFALEAVRPGGDGLRRGLLLGALGAGVALVRVEGVLWVLGALLAVLVGTALGSGRGLTALAGERRRLLVAAAVVAVALAAHLAWRGALYGSLVPNTVAAKSGGGVDVMGRGARQVATWAIVTITPLAALGLAVPALRHPRPEARAAAASLGLLALGMTAYDVLVGGDWMPFFRFLAPATPALVLVSAIGLDVLHPAARAGAALVLVVLQPLALFDVHVAPAPLRESLRFRAFRVGYRSEAERVEIARANAAYFGRLGRALDVATEPGDVLALGAIGSPGWYAPDLDFVDRNGLVTPEVAARDVDPGEGTAGHEKRVPHAWFLDHGTPRPNLLFATWRQGLLDPRDPAALGAAKAAVRRSGMTALPEERELFQRTVLRVVPIETGPAAGCTLLLLERAEPETARRFWSG